MVNPETIEIFKQLSTGVINQFSPNLKDNTARLPLNNVIWCMLMKLQNHSPIRAWISNYILAYHALISNILVKEVLWLQRITPWPAWIIWSSSRWTRGLHKITKILLIPFWETILFIWWYRSGWTFVLVMACGLTAPSHYLNQCWVIVSGVHWHSPKNNSSMNVQATILYNRFENYIFKIASISPGGK